MNQKRLLLLTLLVGLFLFSPVCQAEGEWLSSYNEGVKKADEEGKGLLLLFTGDWIDLCQKFEEEILSKEEFVKPVAEKLVLVKLEFPEGGTYPPEKKELATQMQLLRDAYRVQGFPSVVITDSGGRLFGLNGYQPVTPGEYAKTCVNMADTMEERIEKFEKAGTVEGEERAKLLTEAIPELPGNMSARFFGKEMRAAITADPENKTGKIDLYKMLLVDVAYTNQMSLLAREKKWEDMVELTNRYIENEQLKGGMLQIALLNRYGALEKMGDQEGMVRTMLQVVEVAPESQMGKDATTVLNQWRKNRIEADKKEAAEKGKEAGESPEVGSESQEKPKEDSQKNP